MMGMGVADRIYVWVITWVRNALHLILSIFTYYP